MRSSTLTRSFSLRFFNFWRHLWWAKERKATSIDLNHDVNPAHHKRAFPRSMVDVRSFSRSNPVKIHRPREGSHRLYCAADRLGRAKRDLIGLWWSIRRTERRWRWTEWIAGEILTCERSWPKRKLNRDVRRALGLERSVKVKARESSGLPIEHIGWNQTEKWAVNGRC